MPGEGLGPKEANYYHFEDYQMLQKEKLSNYLRKLRSGERKLKGKIG